MDHRNRRKLRNAMRENVTNQRARVLFETNTRARSLCHMSEIHSAFWKVCRVARDERKRRVRGERSDRT